jgi:hypothetical protein
LFPKQFDPRWTDLLATVVGAVGVAGHAAHLFVVCEQPAPLIHRLPLQHDWPA